MAGEGDRERFARLLALSKIREAQIKANPVPFLNELAERLALAQRACEDAYAALIGLDDIVPTLGDARSRPLDPAAIERDRNERAKGLLREGIEAARRPVEPSS